MKKITFVLCLFLSAYGFAQTFTDSGGSYDMQNGNGTTAATCGTPDELTLPLTVSGVGTLGTTNVLQSVTLNISHTWNADIDVSLQSPDGSITIQLTQNNGGNGDGFVDVILEDGAMALPIANTNPLTGTFAPLESFLTFNGTNADGDWNLLVCDDAGGDVGAVDNWSLTFAPAPSCFNPSNLDASSVLETSAELSWTENGTATLWNIEIVTSGTAPAGTATDTAVMNPFQANGLMSNTSYDYYVQADCGANGTSDWVGPFSFTTACSAFMAPYSEDFEMFTVSTAPFSLENCWSATGGAYFWESAGPGDTSSGNTGPSPSITTGNYFFTEASAGSVDNVTDLVSPLIDLSTLTAPALTFNYHMFGADMGTLEILVNGTDSVFSLSGQQQTSDTDPWELTVIDLSAYANQTITVVFRGIRGADFTSDIAIDNVSFDELPTCSAPSILQASNITADSADLSWTENGTATVWDIEVVDITAGAMVTGNATNAGVSNPFTVTGLNSINDYVYYVRADCGGDFSAWVGPFAFTTECDVFPVPYATDFTTFVPACWDEASNGDAVTGPTDFGFGDWTNNGSIARINLWNANTSDWLITPEFDLSVGGQELVLEMSGLDFNQPVGTYSGMGSDDVLEVYISTDQGTSWTVIYTFSAGGNMLPPTASNTIIDLSAYTGTSNIFGIRGSEGTVDDPEDYFVNLHNFEIRTPLSCGDITNLMVDNLTPNGAEISWGVSPSGETEWEYALQLDGQGVPASGTSLNTTMVNETTLAEQTAYEVYVRAVCGPGDFGPWAGPLAFTTPATPPANDDCAGAVSLTPGATYADNPVDGTLVGATDSGFTNTCGGTATNDVWYTVVVPAGGDITIETEADIATGTIGNDTVLEVYTSDTDCSGTLTSVGCDDDGAATGAYSSVELTAADGILPGQTVYVRLWGFGDDEFEPYSISAFSASLSTENFDNPAAFTYYPNPVKNTLTLSAHNTIENVTMYNMLGQEVLKANPNNVDSTLDMSGLQNGTYFVQVTIANITKTVRVIKQ